MQPIDWQPTVDPNDDGLPGHRRMPSNGSGRSFHSGSDHMSDGGNMAGRGGFGYSAGAGASSDHGHGTIINDLPSHDFTAGPSHLVGGYADLARGPSPQPQMESLARGPSLTRGYNAPYGGPQAPFDNFGPRY